MGELDFSDIDFSDCPELEKLLQDSSDELNEIYELLVKELTTFEEMKRFMQENERVYKIAKAFSMLKN